MVSLWQGFAVAVLSGRRRMTKDAYAGGPTAPDTRAEMDATFRRTCIAAYLENPEAKLEQARQMAMQSGAVIREGHGLSF